MAMAPTRKICVTEIGKTRKLQRMIATELEKRYPDIYKELAFEALGYIEFDQSSPFSSVVDATGTDKQASALVQAHKLFQREIAKKAVAEGYIPKFMGPQTIIKVTK